MRQAMARYQRACRPTISSRECTLIVPPKRSRAAPAMEAMTPTRPMTRACPRSRSRSIDQNEMATIASRAEVARMKPAMRVTNWPDERLEGREEDGFTGGKTALSASWLQEKDYRRGWRIADGKR